MEALLLVFLGFLMGIGAWINSWWSTEQRYKNHVHVSLRLPKKSTPYQIVIYDAYGDVWSRISVPGDDE